MRLKGERWAGWLKNCVLLLLLRTKICIELTRREGLGDSV